MSAILTIGAIFALAVGLLLVAPGRIYITYKKNSRENMLRVSFAPFWGAFKFRVWKRDLRRVAREKREEDQAGPPESVVNRFRRVMDFVVPILRGVPPERSVSPGVHRLFKLAWGAAGARGYACERLSLLTVVGTGDAATTAIAVGSLWAVASIALAGISKGLRFVREQPRVGIRPDFGAPRLDVDVDCILRANVGYIILRGIGTALKADRNNRKKG